MSTSDAKGLVEGYEKSWYIADFWPGEYPSMFSVNMDGVELYGRAEMRLSAPKNIACSVPKLATFSPWNYKRNEADKILYKSVTEVRNYTMSRDLKISATQEKDDKEVKLDLKQGDILSFLVYYSEGYALYRYDNQNYVLNQGDLEGEELTEVAKDLWLRLPANEGGSCWVLYKDAIETIGIIIPEIEGYKIANDLTEVSELSLEGVAFESGSANLTEASQVILDDLATKLLQVNNPNFEVAGYTDSSGSKDGNQKLSQRRAQAVVDYFVEQFDIAPSNFKAVGHGISNPIADNATPEGRSKNRRVELITLGNFLLTKHPSALGMRPGHKLSDYSDMLSKTVIETGEGDFEAFAISHEGSHVGHIDPYFDDSSKIGNINITSPLIIFEKGLSVNLTWGKLKKLVPSVMVNGSEIEGRTHASYENVSFRLNANFWSFQLSEDELKSIKDDTAIIAIQIQQ